MSINGNNNVLLGAGAALPAGVTSNAVVLGGVAGKVYLGGAAVSADSTALALAAGVQLRADANPGAANQVLKSTGTGIQWAYAALSANSTYTSNPWNVESGYTTYVVPAGAAGSPTLTLPAASTAGLVGVLLSVKNVSTLSLSLAGPGLVAVNNTNVIPSATILSGGSCSLASDGTNWFMLDVTGPAPPAPSAPTSVAITTPAAGTTPTFLNVTWSAPLSGTVTSYLANMTQGGVIVGAASVTGATAASIPAATTYNTINSAPFEAIVYAYNSYVAGPEGDSATKDFSVPSNPAINVLSGSNTIVGTWGAPPVSGCTYTATLYKNGGSPLVQSGISLLTCTFSSLTFASGDQYYMTVYATSGGVNGSSAQSLPIAITSSPTGVNIVTPLTQSPATLTVNWTPPSGTITGYVINIYLGNTSGAPVGTYTDNTGTLTSCAVTGTYSISLANLYIATVTAYTGAFAPPSGQSGASSLAGIIFQQPINTQYTTVPDFANRVWALAESVAWTKNFDDDITIQLQLAAYDGGSVQYLLGSPTSISGSSGTTAFSYNFSSGSVLFYVVLTISESFTQNMSPVQNAFRIV